MQRGEPGRTENVWVACELCVLCIELDLHHSMNFGSGWWGTGMIHARSAAKRETDSWDMALFLCYFIDSLEHPLMISISSSRRSPWPSALSSMALAVELCHCTDYEVWLSWESEGASSLTLCLFVLLLSARRRTRADSADPGLKCQSSKGDFKKSCVLRGPEKGPGENVSEAEIHQQNGPKETRCQLGTEGVTGTNEGQDASYS